MPTAKINVKRLREHWIRRESDLMHVYGQKLSERGFRLAKDKKGRWVQDATAPLTVDRGEEYITITQEVPGRIRPGNPVLINLLNRVKFGDAEAVAQLHGLLLAEGDDRAETLGSMEIDIPEDVEMYADTGGPGGTRGAHTEPDAAIVSGSKVAARELCDRTMLLMGMKEEEAL